MGLRMLGDDEPCHSGSSENMRERGFLDSQEMENNINNKVEI